jgi:MFS transporter, DHA2 family, multidrug resistance protein
MAEQGIRKLIVTFSVVIGVILIIIDSTVVNVALSNIIGSFGATVADAGWIVTGYTLACVIILPISGWLGNRIGRKKYFLLSIIGFTIASFLCGNAHSLPELIAFRILQGLVGGGIMSTGQAIILEAWPKEEKSMGMAIFGIGVMIGPSIGPILGGYIVDNFSWQWIFYINIPIGIAAALLVSTFIKETPLHGKGESIDWPGIILLSITIGSLQVVLEKGESEDWFNTAYIVLLTVTAILGGILFVWRELIAEHPVINFSIFRHRGFLIGTITMFVMGLVLYCSMFALPLFSQTILRLTAQGTGALMIPSAIVSMFSMPLVSAVMRKGIPSQYLAVIGVILFVISIAMMSFISLDTGPGFLVWSMVILGIGRGFLFVPFTDLALKELAGKEVGEGTGINNLMQQLGGTVGVAIFATILHVETYQYRNILIENVNIYSQAFMERFTVYTSGFAAKGFAIEQARAMAMKTIENLVMTQAQLLTYNNIYRITAAILLICIPLVLMLKSKKSA